MTASATPSVSAAAAVPPRMPLLERLFGSDGVSFGDLLDLINPIQHVPLLGNLYRRATGDSIDPAMRLAGGALFGGPLGVGFAAAALAFKGLLGETPASGESGASATRVAAPVRYEARGGWMVAASRAGPPAPAPAPAPAPDVAAAPVHGGDGPPRRGGWLAQAAYAMADARAAARLDTRA